MTDISELARRFSRAAAVGRGIRFEADEVDLLVEIGAIDIIQAAAAVQLKERAKCRGAQRQRAYISEAPIGSMRTDELTEAFDLQTSPSTGTTQSEDVSEALRHAQAMSRPARPRSTATISRAPRGNRSAPPAASAGS